MPGLLSLGVPEVPWHPQILADQLTLSQARVWTDNASHITYYVPSPPRRPTFNKKNFLKMCPIFVDSVHDFGRFENDLIW